MKLVITLLLGLYTFSLGAVTAESLYGAGSAYHTHTDYGLVQAGLVQANLA